MPEEIVIELGEDESPLEEVIEEVLETLEEVTETQMETIEEVVEELTETIEELVEEIVEAKEDNTPPPVDDHVIELVKQVADLEHRLEQAEIAAIHESHDVPEEVLAIEPDVEPSTLKNRFNNWFFGSH